MNKINTIICLLALSLGLVSCKEEESIVSFSISESELTFGPESEKASVLVATPGEIWVATSEQSWISISPANGDNTRPCEIRVNTTEQDEIRQGSVRFTNTVTNQNIDLEVTQSGFTRQIKVLSEKEILLENYQPKDKRYFEVEVLTNLNFSTEAKNEAGETMQWLKHDGKNVELSYGFRPVKQTLRFNFESHSDPSGERKAQIIFHPKDRSQEAIIDTLSITQKAGIKIDPNRQGDSLALVSIFEKMNNYLYINYNDRLESWESVKLWEEGEKGATEENIGRVRSLKLWIYNLDDVLPYEFRYLTELETLNIWGNENHNIKSLTVGPNLQTLTKLKSLTVGAHGLESFSVEELGREVAQSLVHLSLSTNLLNRIPEDITAENFPNLTSLEVASNQRVLISDLSNTTDEEIGIEGTLTEDYIRFFRWEKLVHLALGPNYISGTIPTAEQINTSETYTAAEVAANDSLQIDPNSPEAIKTGYNTLVGKPKIMPNLKTLRLNLNRLNGTVPEWLMYHPHLLWFDPYILIFNQEGKDRNGKVSGFDNIPRNLDYYYGMYPSQAPNYVNTEE